MSGYSFGNAQAALVSSSTIDFSGSGQNSAAGTSGLHETRVHRRDSGMDSKAGDIGAAAGTDQGNASLSDALSSIGAHPVGDNSIAEYFFKNQHAHSGSNANPAPTTTAAATTASAYMQHRQQHHYGYSGGVQNATSGGSCNQSPSASNSGLPGTQMMSSAGTAASSCLVDPLPGFLSSLPMSTGVAGGDPSKYSAIDAVLRNAVSAGVMGTSGAHGSQRYSATNNSANCATATVGGDSNNAASASASANNHGSATAT
ncbi:hypothetical protein GGI11_003910, partial [Coemansia sp. RSA 2049]